MQPKKFKAERKAVAFVFLAGLGLALAGIGGGLLVAFVSQFIQAWLI